MDKGQHQGVRPPSFLRVAERATAVMSAVTRGVALPPTRSTHYRKWRAKGGTPSPVERVAQVLVELHACGVSVATLRRVPQALHDLLDDLSTGIAHPRLTADAHVRETALDHAEDTAQMALLTDDTPERKLAWADAAEAHAHYLLELVRGARHEVRTLHLRGT
jgi:hypothetical protein